VWCYCDDDVGYDFDDVDCVYCLLCCVGYEVVDLGCEVFGLVGEQFYEFVEFEGDWCDCERGV